MPVVGPELLYQKFSEYFNSGNLYDLAHLYAGSAVLTTEPGAMCFGRLQISETLKAWLALGGTYYIATRYQMQCGDSALLSAEWRFIAENEKGPVELQGISADVCKRIRDDEWVFVCSNWHSQLTSREAKGPPVITTGNISSWA